MNYKYIVMSLQNQKYEPFVVLWHRATNNSSWQYVISMWISLYCAIMSKQYLFKPLQPHYSAGTDRRTQPKSTPRHSTKNSRRKLAVWMLITAMAVWLGDMSGVDPAKKQNCPHSVGLRYPIDILDANMRVLSI